MINLNSLGDLPSLESIDFQVNSKFPEALNELWKDIFKFKAEYEKDFNIDPVEGAKNGAEAKAKHLAIREFIYKKIQPRFQKIVMKYTGVYIKNIISAVPTNQNNQFSVYCWLSNADAAAMKLLSSGIGLGDEQLISEKDASIKKLTDMSKSLDKARGIVKKNTKMLEFKIGIPISIFTYEDWAGPAISKYAFNVEEITSVILHEIGHSITFITSFADMVYLNAYGNALINKHMHLLENDPKVAYKGMREANDMLGNKSMVSNKVINKLEQLHLTNEENEEYNDDLVVIMIIGKVIINYLMILNCAEYLSRAMSMSIMLPFEDIDWKSLTSSTHFNLGKNLTMHERYADEYVSRFKYSIHLNRALTKLSHVASSMNATGENSYKFVRWMRNSYMVHYFFALVNSPTNIIYSIMGIGFKNMSSYESTRIRLDRNIQNLRDGLNTHEVPDQMKQDMLRDIDIMQRELDDKSSWGYLSYLSKGMIEFIMFLIPKLNYVVMSGGLGSGDVWRTYGRFIRGMDTLLTPRSGEIATRIKMIASKHKR